MSRLLVLIVVLVTAGACSVPEVDLDLPDRSQPASTSPSGGASVGETNIDPLPDDNGTDPGSESASQSGELVPPASEDLDDLEQLVNEIEALLEGVSDELDQISFEEEGG